MSRFVTLLTNEQRALNEGRIDALEAFATEKGPLIVELNRLAEERVRLQTSLGAGNDRAGLETWLSQHPQAAPLKQALAQLGQLADEAAQLNRTNGALIKTRLKDTQQALGILTNASEKAALYGPDGQSGTPGGGGSRLLGSA